MGLQQLDVEVEIRERRVDDRSELAARTRLLRTCVLEHINAAFLVFLLHEVTLQVCVLFGAVLFIFCGVSALKCLVVVPITAFIIWTSVSIAHYADATEKEQRQRHEIFGWVAVAKEPLFLSPDHKLFVIINQIPERHVNPKDNTSSTETKRIPTRNKVVGTVSVEESREPLRTGWLFALAVDAQYRGQGVGRALVQGARNGAAARGLSALEAATSEIQPVARGLLHSLGWETRAAYHRKLCGGAYVLALTHLFCDLQVA